MLKIKNIAEEKENIALKAGLIYIIAELLTRGISFLTTPIFTRLLPPEVFADVKIFESWTYLIAPIISLSLYQSIARAKFDFSVRYQKYLTSIIGLMTSVTIIVVIPGFFFKNGISNLLGFSNRMLLLMIVYCLAYNSIQCLQMFERQLMHYWSNVVLTVLAVVPGVLISVVCVIKYRNSVSNYELTTLRLLSFYGPTTIIGLVIIGIVLVKGKSFYNKEYWTYGIKFSAPLIVFALSTQILYQSDKIMVKALCTKEEAALFALAATVGYIMDILIHAVDNAWRPWLFEKLNLRELKEVKKVWLCLLGIMSVASWIMIALAPELVAFLGGKMYQKAVWLIAPIICGSLGNFIMIGYTAIEQFDKKTKYSGYASLIAAVLNIVLNFIFIKFFGYVAAAYTTAATYIISAIVHYLFVKQFEKNDIFSVRITFLIWFAVLGISMGTMMLFKMEFWIRWVAILVVLTIILLIFRKIVFDIIKSFSLKK